MEKGKAKSSRLKAKVTEEEWKVSIVSGGNLTNKQSALIGNAP